MQFDPVTVVFQMVVFLFAISVHESAHAWTAARFGDPTATLLGRVSLNPIRHIDPIGTVLMPLIAMISGIPLLGWAKPTPVDPRNFGDRYVLADIMTSVAGPASNLLVAVLALLGIIFMVQLVGVVPAAEDIAHPLVLLFRAAIIVNVFLAVFNLIPVPPLDGSHVIRHFMSEGARRVYDSMGMIGLVVLVFWGGPLLSRLVAPVLDIFFYVLSRV